MSTQQSAASKGRVRRADAAPPLLREVCLQQGGAVFVDGNRSGVFEVLFVKGAAGEDGDGSYAGFPGGLDVPEGVSYGDGLVRRGPGPTQGFLEDVGGRFRVVDGAGVDDAVYVALGLQFLHVVLQLFVFRAG